MRLSLSVTLFALASIVSAVRLPKMPDAAVDGFYVAYVDEFGKDVHTLISAPNKTGFVDGLAPSMPKPKLAKRSSGYSWCGCGYNMNHADCDAANADLANQAGGGITVGGGLCYYSVVSSAVAFVCNPYSSQDNILAETFYSDGVGSSDAVITSDCGWYVAGTYAWGYWPSYVVGYMIYYAGEDFFHDSTGSSASGC
jgi:hypothetical protein